MSGAFGWARNDSDYGGGTRHVNSGFDSARARYQRPTSNPSPRSTRTHTPPPPPPRTDFSQFTRSVQKQIPTALHSLKSTAANVLIGIADVTGSMGDNPEEIFKRLPLMHSEATKLLGTSDVEILFIAYGDARTDCHAVQVARFGRGPELDEMLAHFYLDCGGGNQGSETPELIAYYLLKQVDTSSARNVYAWFITDEAGCPKVNASQVTRELGLTLDREYEDASTVFDALKTRMNVFCILFDTGCYRNRPSVHARIKPYWVDRLDTENVIPLNDPRRIVDVMLGSVAVITGQLDLFTANLMSRQMPTRHGTQNVQTVLGSISLLGNKSTCTAKVISGAGTKSLLAGKTGTKSLLDPDS